MAGKALAAFSADSVMRKEFLIWLLALALVGLVGYGYAQQRNIHERYTEFRQNERQLEALREEINALRERVEQARQRVQNMETDPVEMEAAIRRIRRLTREDEIIFRIEEELTPGDTPVVRRVSESPPKPAAPDMESAPQPDAE